MGYYPPYIPDTYLQAVQMIPHRQAKVGRVEPIYKKVVHNEPSRGRAEDEWLKKQTRKGLYVDYYV